MFYIHIIHLKPYVYTTQNKSFYSYNLIGYIDYKEPSTKDVYMLNQSDRWIDVLIPRAKMMLAPSMRTSLSLFVFKHLCNIYFLCITVIVLS